VLRVRVDLFERLKDPCKMRLIDTESGIADVKDDSVVRLRGRDGDGHASSVGRIHRILDEGREGAL